MKFFKKESGQALLIFVFIAAMLVITLPVVVMYNQHLQAAGLHSKNASTALETSEAGLSQVTAKLSASAPIWRGALAMDPTVIGPSNLSYDGSMEFTALSGVRYTIRCSTDNLNPRDVPASSYQLRMLINGKTVDTRGQVVPLRAVQALLSQKTLGASLSDGKSISTALTLFGPMLKTAGDLDVHWGPILAISAMDITGMKVDTGYYPRKFATGAIAPRSLSYNDNTTDGKEYWAFSGVGGVPQNLQSDADSYDQIALNNTPAVPQILCSVSGPITPTSGKIICPAGEDVLIPDNYTVNSNSSVIYFPSNNVVVQGRLNMDIRALVVEGDLNFQNPPAGGGQLLTLRVPPTAALEYAYDPSYNYPCKSFALNPDGSKTCTSQDALLGTGLSRVDFRGFLYVGGKLTVDGDRVLVGAVRIGNMPGITQPSQLVLTHGTLHLFYDDEINHNILADPFLLQRDAVVRTSASQ